MWINNSDASISVAISANLNEIAWNELIGLPNWILSFEYLRAASYAPLAIPNDNAAIEILHHPIFSWIV